MLARGYRSTIIFPVLSYEFRFACPAPAHLIVPQVRHHDVMIAQMNAQRAILSLTRFYVLWAGTGFKNPNKPA